MAAVAKRITRSPGRPAPRARGRTAGRGAWPDFRAVPVAARVVEVTAKRTRAVHAARRQDGQLADLDARPRHRPRLRPARTPESRETGGTPQTWPARRT